VGIPLLKVRIRGKRLLKTQTFDGALYKTEKALRQHLESFVLKLNENTEYARAAEVTFNALLDRYMEEEMPARRSTQGSYRSIVKNHLRPQWGKRIISEIKPAELHTWLQELVLAPITKGHLRRLMHRLFDLATLWEYLPLERRNPIEIVKIKNVTKRQKESVVLTPEQFRCLLPQRPDMPDPRKLQHWLAVLGRRRALHQELARAPLPRRFRLPPEPLAAGRNAYRSEIDSRPGTVAPRAVYGDDRGLLRSHGYCGEGRPEPHR